MNNDKLVSLKALAAQLGVGYSFTRAMKKAGLPTPGGRVCESDARRWLRNNPDFRPTLYLEPNGRTPKTAVAEPSDTEGQNPQPTA